MGKRWIETAVIGACLALAAQVQAQGWPGYGESGPSASGGGGGGAPDFMPGPMRPPLAPPGPGNDLSLSGDAPNAFDPNCPRPRPDYCCNGMWFDVEALLWAVRDPHLNQNLVTIGVPGAAGTTALIGQDAVNYHYFPGGRVDMGFWLNPARTWAVEADGFILEKGGANLTYGPAANLFLTPGPTALSNADPIAVDAGSRLWGVSGNVVCVGCCCGCDIGWIIGYAYRDLTESLDITDPVANLANPDHFRTRNQFSGGDIGLRIGGVGCSGLFFGAQAICGVGVNHESAVLAGDTAVVGGGIAPGGVLVTAANAGRTVQNEFSLVPQGDAKIGWAFSRYMMAYVGYTFLYWRDVIRPGELIPLVPGNPVQFHQVNFWAQGISLGFEMRY
jgi:hypothetical protein